MSDVNPWRRAEARLGAPIPARVRAFLRYQGQVESVERAANTDEWDKAVDEMVNTVRNLRRVGLAVVETAEAVPGDDARWRLLKDLDDAYRRSGGVGGEDAAPWIALSVGHESPPLDIPFPRGAVELRFDHRMSLRALLAQLRVLWPLLRARGWVRATHPIAEQNAEVVRFVCLDQPPGITWRARCDAWNATHPEHSFPDARRFQAAFRRAEEQMTGSRGGLAWFYDRKALEEELLAATLTAEAAEGALVSSQAQEILARNQAWLDAWQRRAGQTAAGGEAPDR